MIDKNILQVAARAGGRGEERRRGLPLQHGQPPPRDARRGHAELQRRGQQLARNLAQAEAAAGEVSLSGDRGLRPRPGREEQQPH